jgi:sialate O-acetylesterase
MRLLALFCACAAGALPVIATADAPALPLLSPIFGDNMVLQRGKPNTFWGWTRPGETVRVEINGHSAATVAGADGRWQTQIEPPAATKECTVKIDGPRHLELQHVLVGDVWLCGGQSNMQLGLPSIKDGAREVAAANHPLIRLFIVAPRSAYSPATTPQGTWKICTPQSVAEDGGFSAVAYFFACRLQQDAGVPIGLIQDCLGGTPAESWISPAGMQDLKDFAQPMAEVARLRQAHAPEYGNYIMHWYDEYDAGSRDKTWADPVVDDHDWKPVTNPGGFEQLGLSEVPAVVWFRKEITLPDPLPKGPAVLHLGVVEKMDTAYVNGHWVGASAWVENPRAYPVPANLFKPGRNLITIRVFKVKSKSGFLSAPDQLKLDFEDGPSVPLAGEWKAKLSVDARPPHPMPMGFENWPVMPAVMFQGMIQPIVPLALTGTIWYQGEANASRAHQYRTILPAMIRNWRNAFGQGDFPFYIVSLPFFGLHHDQPGSDDWAELREAQAVTAASIPHSGLAVTIDTGDADNLHPKDKKPVGERLALLALAEHYGKNISFSGPAYRSIDRSGNSIRIKFDHIDGGLQVHGDELEEFSIAGRDRQWHWAKAKIDGDTVVVTSADVAEPQEVRYAWQSNPKATLFNGAGLPAAPFRSDDWPGVTDQRPPW